MEGGIFLCHWYFLLKARRRRRRDGRQPQDEEADPSKVEGVEEDIDAHKGGAPLNPIFSSTSHSSVPNHTDAQENVIKEG